MGVIWRLESNPVKFLNLIAVENLANILRSKRLEEDLLPWRRSRLSRKAAIKNSCHFYKSYYVKFLRYFSGDIVKSFSKNTIFILLSMLVSVVFNFSEIGKLKTEPFFFFLLFILAKFGVITTTNISIL